MRDFLQHALDLERLSLAGEGVRLGFERALPAWAWVMLVVAAVVVAVASYLRMLGPAPARITLGITRALLLILLAVLISGPQLVKSTETVERDWVLILVDRSASLTLADVQPDGADARITREQSLRNALDAAWPAWAAIADDREVLWLGFDRGAYDLITTSSDSDAPPTLGDPAGRTTAIGAAVEQALARAAARPISAVILVSDGRSIDAPARAALRRLQSDRIPIHTVALGSRDPIGDLAIARIDGPRSAFVGDAAPIRVQLARAGAAAPSGATVRLIDNATRLVLDERRIEPADLDDAGNVEVTLVHRPTAPGRESWSVAITPDGPDLVADNNTSEFDIELVDRPMRVLYLDGYPRWEQRYLRNLLLREQSIVSSGVMLAPDRAYTQEGDVILDEIPDSPERWAEFDAVILGDVRPDMFTREQLAQLRDHIAERGAGLLWIGGESETPVSWWDTPLAELIPFARGASDAMAPLEPFVLTPGPAADALGVLRLGAGGEAPATAAAAAWWPAELSDPQSGWATFYWGQRIDTDTVKPTADVIAFARQIITAERYPAVLTMRYGAGRIAYLATDEIWRYRFGHGEVLYERFWVPLIRMLGRESLARSGAGALLSVSARQVVVETPVRVAVELVDQSLMDRDLRTIDVRIRRTDADPALPPTSTVVSLRRSPASPRLYESAWTPSEPGLWALTALEHELTQPLTESVEAILPRDELRFPEADHDALARLSDETDGLHVPVSDLAALTEHLPNRRLRVLTETTESLWDTPLALALFLLLLTAEWVGRRVIRLV